MRAIVWLLPLVLACSPDARERRRVADTIEDTGNVDDTGTSVVDDGPLGFIGSPCAVDADCTFDGGTCLLPSDGYPRGMCTTGCDRFCDDRPGHPTTFCVSNADLPELTPILDDGACLSRCDFGTFPGTGCRPGYGCDAARRANEPGTSQSVCLPGVETSISTCQERLIARGIQFEPTVVPSDSAAGQACTVQDPVRVRSPLLGVELAYYEGSPTSTVLGACEMIHALADTIEDLKPHGLVRLRHIGTYNCRVIGGTSTLSRHAFGDAIDLYGFELANGSYYTLIDDWQHDNPNPSTPGARFMYDASRRWHANFVWNIILTPDFNAAHDNHFHIDLTPGSHVLRSMAPLQLPGLVHQDSPPSVVIVRDNAPPPCRH